VNFTALKRFEVWELMICATHLRTGLPRYFGNQDLTMDALLASACLPMVFQAVEVGGHAYWDGGYSANPPLAPFIERGTFDELVLVRINVSQRKERPTSAADIMTRASEISFSASLNAELRMLDSLTQLAHTRKVNALLSALPSIEVIAADDALQAFDAESKMDTDWEFLNQLHNIGRKAAKSWLKQRSKVLT
jgi:NTE family protein